MYKTKLNKMFCYKREIRTNKEKPITRVLKFKQRSNRFCFRNKLQRRRFFSKSIKIQGTPTRKNTNQLDVQ